MEDLASKTCVPCKGGTPPLKGQALAAYVDQVPQWRVVVSVAQAFSLWGLVLARPKIHSLKPVLQKTFSVRGAARAEELSLAQLAALFKKLR